MQCPDSNRLASFVRGESDDEAAIAEHLDGCEECSLVVETLVRAARPVGGYPAEAARKNESAPLAIDRGTSIGRYLVIDLIGAGGMGVVYSAYDPQLDRKVALKLLWSSRGRAIEQSRLLREAQTLARISHPNVIAVYDVGVFQDSVFMAMEFVQGDTLGEWLQASHRSTGDVLGRFIAAGDGLAAAHEAGVVHRDFKPDNVVLGADGRVRVTDFGLARTAAGSEAVVVPGGAPEPRPPTPPLDSTEKPGTLRDAGTPGYMAPEQLLGRPADARADQFAFCVALFEALYGRRPFVAANRTDLLAAMSAGAPHEHSSRSILGSERQPPRWLRQVVRRGLSFDPAERFPSMNDLLPALRRDRRRLARRHLVLGTLVLGALVVLGAHQLARDRRLVCRGAEGELAGVWDARQKAAVGLALRATGVPYADRTFASTARILDEYSAAWVAARTEACEATRLRGEQSEELLDRRIACLDERLGEVRALVDVLVHADARTAENAVRSARSLGDLAPCGRAPVLMAPNPAVLDRARRAQVQALRQRLARAKALQDAARVPAGRRLAEEALTAARRVGWRPLEAEALLRLGDLQESGGEFREAEQTLRRAIVAAESGRSDAVSADAWSQLAFVVGNRLARPAEALTLAEYAKAAVERLGDDPRRRAHLLHVIAAIRPRLGQWQQAIAAARRALAIRERVLGPFHIELSNTLNNLGTFLEHVGRLDEALACHQRALAIREREVGLEHPLAAASFFNIGALYERRGDLDAALASLVRARRIFEKTLGTAHPAVVTALAGEGDVLLAKGRCREALARDLRSIAIGERALGPSHPTMAWSLTQAGEAHLSCGDPSQATTLLERALGILVKAAGEPADLGRTRFVLARALWRSGLRRERARSVALARAALGDYEQAATSAKDRDAVAAWLRAHH